MAKSSATRTLAAAEGLAELLSLGAELLPAFVAVEDEEAADGGAGWLPPGMTMTATTTTAAATAAAAAAITQVLGRCRICLVSADWPADLVCADLVWAGPEWLGWGWLGWGWLG